MKRFVLEFATEGAGEIVNLSPMLTERLRGVAGEGLAHLFAVGSTCALTTMEFEPGLIKHDIKNVLQRLVPDDARYEHDATWNDDNGHAHTRAALIGPGLMIPISHGKPLTGEYQQIVFLDFDTRPRKRKVIVTVMT